MVRLGLPNDQRALYTMRRFSSGSGYVNSSSALNNIEHQHAGSLTDSRMKADNGQDDLVVTELLELTRLRCAESRGLFSFWFPGSLGPVDHLHAHAVGKH